ncbi:MAG: TonB-dependent receptor [Pseudomonadota bacterium]
MSDSNLNVSRAARAQMPAATLIATALIVSAGAQAQEAGRRSSASALLEEVVVTARKRAEGSQEVPLSISAFSSDQIDALKIRDLTNLAVGMPNVALDDIGTTRGTANFSIRGLGINSSIPSIDPTVGVFINGVYLGLNNGIVFDVFDLESIEVLRGPQGILFGRNVTGGAVLLNTKKPGESFEGQFRAAVDGGGDGGLNRYLMGTVGGPATDTLGLKLTAYWNDDEGYFENGFDGGDVGAVEQRYIRGTAVWAPTDRTEIVVRYENGDIDGDGPVPQSHTNGSGLPGTPVNSDPDSFDVNYDLVGFQKIKTDFFTAELNHDVDFGGGTVTAIYGYRDTLSDAFGDIDAQALAVFHAPTNLRSEQNSLEFRYNGRFGDANVTTGVYWFDNDIEYHERRDLLGSLTPSVSGGAFGSDVSFQIQDGGGLYTVETLGIFAAVDYDLTDVLSLTLGARWSSEEKSANVATLALNTNVLSVPASIGVGTPIYVNPRSGTDTRCNIVNGPACGLDFNDSETFNTLAPKIGLSYAIDDNAQLYGHWSRGFRSGGYNLRNTSPTAAPGPFGEEQVDSFELGYKSAGSWGKLNAAVFYNTVDDMQREVNLPDVTSGVVQIIDNTADATLWGFEVDGAFSISEAVVVLASLGYIDASYDSVAFDLNGDGVADSADKNLDLPRAPELTYSVGLTYDFDLGSWGYASARVSYAYRDEVAYTDNNLGTIPEQDILDAGLDFYSGGGGWTLSLYGRNLLDTVKWGGDTQLPATLGPFQLGGTFSPLARGRVYGAQLTFDF